MQTSAQTTAHSPAGKSAETTRKSALGHPLALLLQIILAASMVLIAPNFLTTHETPMREQAEYYGPQTGDIFSDAVDSLSAVFDNESSQVAQEGNASRSLHMSLTGYAYDGPTVPVPSTESVTAGNHVECRHVALNLAESRVKGSMRLESRAPPPDTLPTS